MFSTKLTHLAHRASCAAALSAPSSSTAAATAHRSTQCAAARAHRPHQRRHSSSKASCPPENSASGGKPAPASKETATTAELSNPETNQKGIKRITRTKRSRPTAAAKPEDQFAGLPAVPGTQHINYADLTVSSFFSLHRPLSLTSTIPPPSSASAFDSIFEKRPEQDPWENGDSAERRPEDVVYALANYFQDLDIGASAAQEDGRRAEGLKENQMNQENVTHLDGAPRLRSLEDVVASFQPYHAPPPPQPFVPEQKIAKKKRSTREKAEEKRYSTTIFITESTSANGESTWTASSSPVIRVSGPEDAAIQEPRRSPLPVRRREREVQFWRVQRQKMLEQTDVRESVRKAPSATQKYKMLLISVKRQRKLKMKKHKYKKLMKRTRNLRRRQDRA